MRIFRGRLFFDKETDEAFRWKVEVGKVEFKLYIEKSRSPKSAPAVIEVSIFDDPKLYTVLLEKVGKKTVKQLTAQDRPKLNEIGLDENELGSAGDDAIFGAAFFAEEKTETVRYNAGRLKGLQFGDPYIPQSVLRCPYPERLLFLVRWIT